ncbi:sugar transferase [Timonella senegalensis]|uniref:sugar transferase n=1 Tax=Timonella senegalensis TaxID=1465825 RepID=UPI002FDD5323
MAVMTKPVTEVGTGWQRSYSSRLLTTDFLVILVSVFGAQLIRFGTSAQELQISESKHWQFALSYTLVSLILVFTWMAALAVFDTRELRVVGTGPTEYKLMVETVLRVFGLLAIVGLLFQFQMARGYLLIAFPAGLVLLLLSRWLWRQWLIRKRKSGEFLHRAVLVGEYEKVDHVATQIGRDSASGFQLVSAITTASNSKQLDIPGIPTSSNYDAIVETLENTQADTLILASADVLGPKKMRRLGWELEQRKIDLVVAPALTDIAGPRIHTRPVAGLPLIHIEYPEFTGRKYWVKRVFDIILASMLIVLLSPVLLVVALLVKSDGGPVIFKQERVGQNHEPFKMFKFRSMVVDAELKLAALLDQTDGNGVLFKMKNDPRITPVGRVLRRFSIDELPQLFNVLNGTMSLVGPRPPLPSEVENYDDLAGRRLLVKPGITGLWQVSGRSDLSWDDSIRLDLYYVENWSLMGDIIILYRTFRAVFASDGAY